MAADTATFTPPKSVTIPGEAAFETLALLEAYVTVCAEIRGGGDDAFDDLYKLQDGSNALRNALPDPSNGMATPPWRNAMYDRGEEIAEELRGLLRGNDTLRLAQLEEAVLKLGQEVIGVFWNDDKRRWTTLKAYSADVEKTSNAG